MALDELFATGFLLNSDSTHYGPTIQRYVESYAKSERDLEMRDEYPKTLDGAFKLMDRIKKPKKKNNNGKSNKKKNNNHVDSDNENESEETNKNTNLAQMGTAERNYRGNCHCCGIYGHAH